MFQLFHRVCRVSPVNTWLASPRGGAAVALVTARYDRRMSRVRWKANLACSRRAIERIGIGACVHDVDRQHFLSRFHLEVVTVNASMNNSPRGTIVPYHSGSFKASKASSEETSTAYRILSVKLTIVLTATV
jgi:hypothetical protein